MMPAIRFSSGRVLSSQGACHPVLRENALNEGLIDQFHTGEVEDGFVDEQGRFFDREAALDEVLRRQLVSAADVPRIIEGNGGYGLETMSFEEVRRS